MLYQEQTPIQSIEKDDRVLRLQYGGRDGVMDLIRLSMARTFGLSNSFEAERFSDLTSRHPEHEKFVEQRGEEFDVAIGSFVIAMLIARPRVELYANDNEGIEQSGYFPWLGRTEARLESLGRQNDFELIITPSSIGAFATKKLVAA